MALNFPSNPSENDIYQFGLLTYIFKKGKWVSQSRGASQLPWYSNMEQARALWKRLAAEAGLNLVDGSFEEGAEITSSSDVVWWQAGSAIYSWHLNENKEVPIGSTPATSGGIGAGAWVDRTDVTLRSELLFNAGTVIECNNDIQIESSIELMSNQVVSYGGGKITTSHKGAALSGTSVSGARINGARLSGTIDNGPSTGNVGYAVNFLNSDNIRISDVNTEKFTGSVLLTNCVDCVIRDVRSRANRYHSDVVAGGYGVLLQGTKRTLVDGINFEADADKGDLGRHSFYISVNPIDPSQFCEDVIVRGVISRKNNLKNRGMWDAVIRYSNNVLITDFDCRGSNGGFSAYPINGPISNLKISNGTLDIVQYDNNAVYGIDAVGLASGTPYNDIVGLVVDNVEILMSDDTTVVTNPRMVAINLLARNSRVSNLVIRTPGDSTPILINGGLYLQIDGVQDFTTRDGSGLVEFIRFTAPTSKVKISNIQTRRPMFAGLDFVSDMTVDYTRKITANNIAGTLSKTDVDNVVSSVTFSGANMVIAFKDHVTQSAVDNCKVEAATADTAFVITSRANKSITLRVTTLAGVVIGQSGTYVLNVSLFS